MTRVIAFDVGTKRVGVAVSDPLMITAQPLMTIERKPHGQFLYKVASIAAQYEAQTVVLGLPRRTDGTLGPEAQRVLALAHELKTRLNLNIATFDERLTTAMADRVMAEAGLKGDERRKVVDKTAATIILSGYLDSLKVTKNE
ncbi:MAG: Holliday junction resolvase RuvX [Deltaproteobacteria bacterium]|nr:Holliday junction resolvase RuvX [Deltaproteobacteria bacterium]